MSNCYVLTLNPSATLGRGTLSTDEFKSRLASLLPPSPTPDTDGVTFELCQCERVGERSLYYRRWINCLQQPEYY